MSLIPSFLLVGTRWSDGMRIFKFGFGFGLRRWIWKMEIWRETRGVFNRMNK